MNQFVSVLFWTSAIIGIISVIATAYQTFILTEYTLLAWDEEEETYITYVEYLEL